MTYPDWVLKEKKKGTEVVHRNGKYYLYKISSVWNKEKGRAQKVTLGYLGRITEDKGLIPPKRRGSYKDGEVSAKEYGASKTLCELGKDILNRLEDRFPKDYQKIFSIAALRVIERCPFKGIDFLYEKSFLSERFGKLALSSSSISRFLRELGSQRPKLVGFMKEYVCDVDYLFFDLTNIISKSENVEINRVGYNSHHDFDPQIGLMYAFSADDSSPTYYRVIPGNIRDVRAFKGSIEEASIKDAVIVADKGFGSQENFKLLREANLKYIVPLRRNNSNINREILRCGDKSKFENFFFHNARPIWPYSYKINEDRLIVCLDESLKAREEADYLRRVQENIEGYTKEGFIDKQYQFGTITFQTNLDLPCDKVFCLYKARNEIEMTFDFLKNLLDQDRVYLQDKYAIEAWAFINHISLMLVYLIYHKLKESELISKYSIQEFITHLKYISYLKIGDSWVVSEISGKTQKILEKLKIHITQT